MIQLRYPRQRIFVAFLIYTLLSFGVATLSFWLFRRVESISYLSDKVHQVHISIRKLSKFRSDFLINEPLNEEYYKTGSSRFLKGYKVAQSKILTLIDSIKESPQAEKWNMTQELDTLGKDVFESVDLMRELSNKMRLRGYKNYGLEGVMREYIRKLDDAFNVNQVLVLQLRRHEKDFINRLDSSSLEKWKANYKLLVTDIISQKDITSDQRRQYLAYLGAYQESFYHFVEVDYEIGYRQETGLAAATNKKDQFILQHISKLDSYTQKKKSSILLQLRFTTVVVVTVSVITSMLLSLAFPYIIKV